jgi:GTP1/Obg family GTP-binding protein
MKTSPDFTTLPEFYKNYVAHVQDLNVLEALQSSISKTIDLLQKDDEEM